MGALLNKNTLLAPFGPSTIAPNLQSILSPKVSPQSLKAHHPPVPERNEGQVPRSRGDLARQQPRLVDRSRQADFHAQRRLGDPRGAPPHFDDVRALEHDSAQAHRYKSKALLAPRRDEATGDPDLEPRASRQSRWRSLHPRSAQKVAERWSRPPGRPEEPGRDPARRLSNHLV